MCRGCNLRLIEDERVDSASSSPRSRKKKKPSRIERSLFSSRTRDTMSRRNACGSRSFLFSRFYRSYGTNHCKSKWILRTTRHELAALSSERTPDSLRISLAFHRLLCKKFLLVFQNVSRVIVHDAFPIRDLIVGARFTPLTRYNADASRCARLPRRVLFVEPAINKGEPTRIIEAIKNDRTPASTRRRSVVREHSNVCERFSFLFPFVTYA